MADYSNTLNSGGAIKTWRDARDDAELSSLVSGDTWTLTFETNTEDSVTCLFGSGFWAGINIIIKSDVKYKKYWSYMRTAGVPSGDEHIHWGQGGTGTLDISDINFDEEADEGPFGLIRNLTIPTGEQKYGRCGFARNANRRAINNCSADVVFVNCFFTDFGDDVINMTGVGPKIINCIFHDLGNNQIMFVANETYDNETKNILADSYDEDHNDTPPTPDADYCASVNTSASQFTFNAVSKPFDTTRMQSVSYSEATINAKTFLQIKNHTSDAGMYGLAGIAPTYPEPTDDYYGTVRDTANRDLGATAIAASAGPVGGDHAVMRGINRGILRGVL